MARRSLRWRGFGVDVEVPERVATAAKKLVRRGKGAGPAPNRPLLEFPRSSPQLHLRYPAEPTSRYMDELRMIKEWHPDLWNSEGGDGGDDLAAKVKRIYWYHTLELPGGVVTPGYYDHRTLVPYYGIPGDLTGKRVLDGRGADVTAVDLDHLTQTDLPTPIREAVLAAGLEQTFGGGFKLARDALGSKVNRVVSSVYDLDPATLGTFDLVHFSDVALHLERPLDAFRKIRSVTGGHAMIVDSYDPALDDPSRNLTEYQGGWVGAIWWNASLNTQAQMLIDAGFSDVRIHNTYRLNPPSAEEPGRWRAIFIATP